MPHLPASKTRLQFQETCVELHFAVGYIVQKVPGQHHTGGRGPSGGCGGRWQLFWNPVAYGLYSQRWGVRVTLWLDGCTSLRSPRLEFILHRSLFPKHRIHYASPRFQYNTTTDEHLLCFARQVFLCWLLARILPCWVCTILLRGGWGSMPAPRDSLEHFQLFRYPFKVLVQSAP